MTEPRQAAITDAELDEFSELEKRATPWPWFNRGDEFYNEMERCVTQGLMVPLWRSDEILAIDAHFISKARNIAPRLVERVRELEALVYIPKITPDDDTVTYQEHSISLLRRNLELTEQVREQDAEIASLNREMNNMLAEATKQDAIIAELSKTRNEIYLEAIRAVEVARDKWDAQGKKHWWPQVAQEVIGVLRTRAALAKVESVDEGEK